MQKIDSVQITETPEGIQLYLRCAGLSSRMLAALVDGFVLLGAIYLLATIAPIFQLILGPLLLIVLAIGVFLLFWFYPVACEMMLNGQTVGKKALGLRVIQASGTPIGWRNSITRALLLAVDWIPCIGLPVMLLNGEFRRLGDIAADTLVIHVRNRRFSGLLPNVEPESMGSLTAEENRAVLAFAQRHEMFTLERNLEIASHVAPALGVSNNRAVDILYRHAKYLVEGKG